MIFLYSATFMVFSFSLLACMYYWFLLAVRILKSRPESLPEDIGKSFRFALVVPAHNEEQCIVETIQSCNAIDYPEALFSIIVIADNCDDKTAEFARNEGATVLERRDKQHRGKGFALEFAFSTLLDKSYDAFVVIDADCTIDSNSLNVLACCLANNEHVVQLDYRVSNPDASVMTYALAVGNYIENTFFYAPKFQIGLAVFLRGTGMMFHRNVLLENPWKAHSITEDIEYGINLLKKGVQVKFVENVKVSSPFPVVHEQLKVQRGRWAEGNFGFGRKEALKLIVSGIYKRNWGLVDAGYTFMVLSRPLVLLGSGLSLALSLICWYAQPDEISIFLLSGSILINVFLGIYFICGIVSMGLSAQRVRFLLQVPVSIGQLIWISLAGLVKKSQTIWVRTPR